MTAQGQGFFRSAAGDARQYGGPACRLFPDDIHQTATGCEIHGNGFAARADGKDAVKPSFNLHFHQLTVHLFVKRAVGPESREHGGIYPFGIKHDELLVSWVGNGMRPR